MIFYFFYYENGQEDSLERGLFPAKFSFKKKKTNIQNGVLPICLMLGSTGFLHQQSLAEPPLILVLLVTSSLTSEIYDTT